jgi:hypothetical protein
MSDVSWCSPLAAAARRNLIPGLVLQALALALVLAYYLIPATRSTFETVAQAKVAGGYCASGLSAAIAAGLIPWLVEAARGTIPPGRRLGDCTFVVLLWAWRGAEVDAFYRFQGWLWGTGTDVGTIACKVALDMLVYAPLWAQPILVAAYRVREQQYDLAAYRRTWTWSAFARQILTVQASGWAVWIPAVSIIYALPGDLQFPLFAVMVCFWSLLLATLSARR